MTESTIKAQSSSYLQKIINSDFDMGSINTDGLPIETLPNSQSDKGIQRMENDKGVPRMENDKGVPRMENDKGDPRMENDKGVPRMETGKGVPRMETGKGVPRMENDKGVPRMETGKGVPRMENDKGVPKMVNANGSLKMVNDKGVPVMRKGKGIPGMKTVPSVKSTEKDKSIPNIISISDATENGTPATVSSEDMFRDIKCIDSEDSTIVPKSPSFGRPYHIKTNGSLNSSNCPSDAEMDKMDVTSSTNEQVKINTLPKQNNFHILQRRHSEMEGINKESYMIGNQFKSLSGTASLERNIHLHPDKKVTPTAADERRLSGWYTIGHSYKRINGGEFDRTKRTTWGGKYASRQRASLKVLNELDNAYNYSSDSSGENYYEANERPTSSKVKPRHKGEEMGVEDVGPDDVFISQTNLQEDKQVYEESLQEYLSVCMSGIYGIFLVVIGFVIPMAETFADPLLPFVFEAFYIYLYVVGILFIVYVYVFMMRRRRMRMRDFANALSRRLSSSKAPTTSASISDRSREGPSGMHQSINYPNFTGSFYLRLGAVMFGIGSMVDSGLHFGQHFQAFDSQSKCNTPIEAIKPFGHLVFTFVQLYFIFLNSKLCIHNNRTIARFGMIHLCCTNICVWVQSLVVETLSVLHHWNVVYQTQGVTITPDTEHPTSNQTVSHVSTGSGSPNVTVHGPTPEVKCYWDDMMARVVQSTGPYLYSCTIEYSIICTGILYVMWTNVGTHRKTKHQTRCAGSDSNTQNDDDNSSFDRKRHKISVDCTNSSRGLFIGILLSVGAIITMVAFYVMINLKAFQETAIVLMLLSEMTMYILTSIAGFLAAERMHKLRHYSALRFGLEESLLLASFTGLLMFGVFNIIPDVHYTDKALGVLNVMTNVLMILQASIQAVLLLTTRKLRAFNKEQEKAKYGRQFITFLILCNFALWTLETFQSRDPNHNPIQVDLYGIETWALFSHTVVPLAIFFRFHSFVYLLSIWKSAWKMKTETEQN